MANGLEMLLFNQCFNSGGDSNLIIMFIIHIEKYAI